MYNLVSILLVDDDPDDRMLFQDAISEIDSGVTITSINDGEELMDYLINSASFLPEIIFLDLNMPRKNGFQCLEEIRAIKSLNEIYIVIYSTTGSQREIDEVYNMGANLFLNKPNSYTELKQVLAKVLQLDLREPARLPRERFIFNASEN